MAPVELVRWLGKSLQFVVRQHRMGAMTLRATLAPNSGSVAPKNPFALQRSRVRLLSAPLSLARSPSASASKGFLMATRFASLSMPFATTIVKIRRFVA
jgi:hypothetical protein